ncbi:histidine kinase [Rippkaea orientalis PCC 8801]|uniref:histidine kinase n=1 Tax=Rippkaea orientalis (strain PCC 8801 / RF-1) TaxID=41431 RepID=B7K4X9_RIPO1|nr:histidine kinase dimerization/phospho-acceptor domain-containing protein [Rippkaea orientalis]ACK66635.1 histidine kinase [Rippkaea orientalis PCC 8801]
MDKIEALKQELEQTKLAYQMAAQLSQFKSGFLVKTSHELRSPLSSLMGLHQLILSDLCESPEEQREFIAEAYQAAQKLMNMIDEIMTVSKIEYGKITLQNQVIPLARVFSQLHELTHLQATNRSLTVTIIPLESEVYIKADSQRFLQALVTLVDAGITIAQSGKITISTNLQQGKNYAQINLNFPNSFELWQAEKVSYDLTQVSLESIKAFSHQVDISPGLKFLLCQTLLEKMGGQLTLIDLSSSNDSKPLTQLVLLIPLASDQEVDYLEEDE